MRISHISFAVFSLFILVSCGAPTTVNVSHTSGSITTGNVSHTIGSVTGNGIGDTKIETGITNVSDDSISETGVLIEDIITNTGTSSISESTGSMKRFTLTEIGEHATKEDCYTAINGKVYDVTAFFGKHPGGDQNLFRVCGIDATSAFTKVHGGQERPENTLEEFVIGTIN